MKRSRGSWTVWNDTPASDPCSSTRSPGGVEPDPQAVPGRLRRRRHLAPGLHHLGDHVHRHDASGEQGGPKGADVRRGGEDAAVPAASDRQVEDVGPRSVLGEVAERRPSRELVRAQELRVHHAGGFAHALPQQLVERCPGGALCDQREHHEAAVAVREPLVRRELGLEPLERSEVVLGGSELLDGDGRHVVERFAHDVLVVVVADAGSVREQVFDGHGVVDQRQIVAQHRACGGRPAQPSFLDQAHHGQGGQALGAARDPEPSIDLVRDLPAPMCEPVGLDELDLVAPVDTHDAREGRLGGDPIDGVLQAAQSTAAIGSAISLASG